MKRLLTAIFLCVIWLAAASSAVSADTPVNGISVYPVTAACGRKFTVSLYAPPSENADTASIKVAFDSSAFEVISWEASLPGGFTNCENGFFAVSAANATRAIDLSGGLELTAVLKVRDNAKGGKYTFELADSSLCYVDDSGCEFIELWTPDSVSADVNVLGRGAAGDGGEAKTLPASSQSDVSADSGNNMAKIFIVAGAAVLIAGICFAAVRFGKRRK